MRALDVNLASQPFRNNTLLWVGYGLGFTLLLGFLAWNVTTWLELRSFQRDAAQRLEDMDSRMAELDRRERVARREQNKTELDLQALSVQAVAANEVIERKAFSWTRLFNRMEETIPWNVHLTSVRPLFHDRRNQRQASDENERKSVLVSVEGYAKDLSAFLDFETALIHHESFDFPEPKRHQRNERDEIVFELDFIYYPEEFDVMLEARDDGSGGEVPDVAAGKDEAPVAAEGEAAADAGSEPALAQDAGPAAGPETGPGAAEPEPGEDATLRPGEEPPRIPPRPYATEPGENTGRRKPPQRRNDDEDQ